MYNYQQYQQPGMGYMQPPMGFGFQYGQYPPHGFSPTMGYAWQRGQKQFRRMPPRGGAVPPAGGQLQYQPTSQPRAFNRRQPQYRMPMGYGFQQQPPMWQDQHQPVVTY